MDNALMRYDNKNGRFVDAGYGYWVGTWQSLYLYDPISDSLSIPTTITIAILEPKRNK